MAEEEEEEEEKLLEGERGGMGDSSGSVSIDVERISFGGKVRALCFRSLPFLA